MIERFSEAGLKSPADFKGLVYSGEKQGAGTVFFAIEFLNLLQIDDGRTVNSTKQLRRQPLLPLFQGPADGCRLVWRLEQRSVISPQ